jgi:malate dehydrogenase (oxaloacetate-decarboxylating)
MRSADVFIGVSSPNMVTPEMVKTMNRDAVIFAMANPEPEIMPDLALQAGARIVGTGRSDFSNQINNVLAFPGIFKGALASRAGRITDAMKAAAAYAIASAVPEGELNESHIIPSVFQEGIADAVADAVAAAWHRENERR